MLSYDEDRHRYYLDGEQIPGTTEILRAGGGYQGSEWMTDDGRDRGTAVHAVCRDIALGLLEEDEIDAIEGLVRPYVQAFMLFKHEAMLEVEAAELLVSYDADGIRFATMIDLVGRIVGQTDHRPCVIDIKTGAKDLTVGPQTAAQVLALDGRQTARERYALYLKKNGLHQLDRLFDPLDFERFTRAFDDWVDATRKGERQC